MKKPALFFILFFILLYSLQFMSCTTTQPFPTPVYPRYVQLDNGNYGTTMYSASTPEKKAMLKTVNNYCDTAKQDYPKQIKPVPPTGVIIVATLLTEVF